MKLVRDLLGSRELLYFLAWRDVKIRYKQTILGAAWAVLLAVNALGSAGAGLLIANDVDGPWATVIGIGLLGAFTTFSAFALEVRRLGPTRGAAYAVATVVICCTVVALAAAT